MKVKEAYPYNQEEMHPHDGNKFTKEKISSRFKYLKYKYRKAVDNGRSGGDRVVATFYQVCCDIWSAKYGQWSRNPPGIRRGYG